MLATTILGILAIVGGVAVVWTERRMRELCERIDAEYAEDES